VMLPMPEPRTNAPTAAGNRFREERRSGEESG
jgi:hypothetical protein